MQDIAGMAVADKPDLKTLDKQMGEGFFAAILAAGGEVKFDVKDVEIENIEIKK